MDFRYVKSVVYLLGFTGLGYGLLEICTKDDGRVTSKVSEVMFHSSFIITQILPYKQKE